MPLFTSTGAEFGLPVSREATHAAAEQRGLHGEEVSSTALSGKLRAN
jgi:hypothetical protein